MGSQNGKIEWPYCPLTCKRYVSDFGMVDEVDHHEHHPDNGRRYHTPLVQMPFSVTDEIIAGSKQEHRRDIEQRLQVRQMGNQIHGCIDSAGARLPNQDYTGNISEKADES